MTIRLIMRTPRQLKVSEACWLPAIQAPGLSRRSRLAGARLGSDP
jgi:hypothetical protein